MSLGCLCYHIQKAALTTSVSLFMVNSKRIEVSFGAGMKTYSVSHVFELRNSMVWHQFQLEVD